MGETAQVDDGSQLEFDAVSAVGTALSGIAMAGLLVPVRQGVDDPVVLTALALAVVALGVFLVRRHGLLERSTGAPIAAVASLTVLLLSGYALNQGVTGSVGLPVVSDSFPLVLAAFLAAGGAVGMAVADYVDISSDGLKRRTAATASLALLGVVGLLSTYLVVFVVAAPVYLFVDELSQVQLTALSQVSMAISTAIVAVGYLRLSGKDLSFIDLRMPTKRDVGWVVGGIVVLFGTLYGISLFLQLVGVENADHGTTEQAAQNPEILLVLVPAAILIIGPFEELLYRNVIQKSLYDVFSRGGAIVVGSVIFASVHTLAYGTAGIGAVVASLGVIFGLSLVLATIYERTENLLVPAAVHGVYNALLFANLYVTYV